MKLEVPNKWQHIPLEQLLEFVTGGDWGKDETYEDADFDFAYCIRGSEIKNWDEDKGKTASLRKVKRTSIESRKLKEGDILVEISGGGPEQPVGRTVLIDKTVLSFQPKVPKICTNFLRLIRAVKGIDSKYLNLYLKLFYASGEIVNYQGGSNNLRNLKFPDYVKIKIPVPPLSEQTAIVSKIEELLSDLEHGKQQLLTAQQQLKTYRQSLLKWAFEDLKNQKSIEEIAQGYSIGLVKSSKEQNENGVGVPYIKMNNVDLNGNVDFKDVVYVETKNGESEKYSLKKGDILINTRNSVELVGKTGIVREEKPKGVFNNNLLRIRTKEDYNPFFITYQLISPELRRQMTKEKKATTNVCALYQRDIFPLKLKVTDLREQEQIVSELESKLTVCDKIEETITTSLQQAETLKQSILKKAFEGKLI